MTQIYRHKNRRVLVVGAKFGEVYLNAFVQSLAGLELAGLLARGSRRAQQLAHDFGIPLYTHLEQVPSDIDIACIVVRSTVAQGDGSQLAADFLHRGVHVLQEHPVHPDDIIRLQKLANERDLLYWINRFYPHVPAGRCWIERAACLRNLPDAGMPCSAHLTTSRQLLYSALDLLLQACGVTDSNDVQIESQTAAGDCFTALSLSLPGGCQATLRLQSYLDSSDPDMFSLVMHQTSLVWSCGYLTLESSYGPVLWTGTFHDPEHGSRERTMYRAAGELACYAQPVSRTLHEAPDRWRDAFEIDGSAAIAHVLGSMCRGLDNAEIPTAFSPAYQLALAKLWRRVLHAAPPVAERRLIPPKLITQDEWAGGLGQKSTE